MPTSYRTEFNGLPIDNWHHFLRLRDLHQILSEIPLEGVSRVLELGAGDGVQTDVLRRQFPEVISIDIENSIVLLKGSLPGAKNSLVILRKNENGIQ